MVRKKTSREAHRNGPARRPSIRRRSTSLDAELNDRLDSLDRATRAAILTILEIVGDIERPRATQLIEAMATVVAFATRTSPVTPSERRR
jgi:hypothetical protein